VKFAFGFQLFVAAALLGCAGLIVADGIHYSTLIDAAASAVPGADPAEVDDARGGNVAGAVLAVVPVLVLAAWLAATAAGLLRPSNRARILSVAGLAALPTFAVLCCGAGAALAGVLLALPAGADPFDVARTPFAEKLDTLDNGGFADTVTSVGSGLVGTAGPVAIAAIVLLFTEPANRYFRPPAGLTPYTFVPPVPPAPPPAD